MLRSELRLWAVKVCCQYRSKEVMGEIAFRSNVVKNRRPRRVTPSSICTHNCCTHHWPYSPSWLRNLLIAIQLNIQVAQPLTIFEFPLYTLFAPNFYAVLKAHLFEKNILRQMYILFNTFFKSSPDGLTRAARSLKIKVLFATDVDGCISGRANDEVTCFPLKIIIIIIIPCEALIELPDWTRKNRIWNGKKKFALNWIHISVNLPVKLAVQRPCSKFKT